MFQSGMNPTLGTTFASRRCSSPSPADQNIQLARHALARNIRFTVPMLNALAFVSMFVIAPLGIFMPRQPSTFISTTRISSLPTFTMCVRGSMFGIFAAIYYYYPNVRQMMNNPSATFIHRKLIFFNAASSRCIFGHSRFPRRRDYLNYDSSRSPGMTSSSACAVGLG